MRKLIVLLVLALSVSCSYWYMIDWEDLAKDYPKEEYISDTIVITPGVNFAGTFRIPFICTNNNVLIVGTEIRYGSMSDFSVSDIGIRRSFDNGHTWGPDQIIIENNGVYTNPYHGSRVTNPTVIMTPDRIWLFCTKVDDELISSYYGSVIDTAFFKSYFGYIYSDDDGATWSDHTCLNELYSDSTNILYAGPGNGIVMDNGTLVVPFCDYRFSDVWWDHNNPTDWGIRAGIIYSEDNGLTWRKSNTLKAFTDESAVIEYEPGRLIMYSRSAARYLYAHISDDMGETWTPHISNKQLTGINTQVAAWKYESKYLISMPEDLYSRQDITVRESEDLISWDDVYQLSEGIAYGYTGLCSNSNGRLFATLEDHDGIHVYDLTEYVK